MNPATEPYIITVSGIGDPDNLPPGEHAVFEGMDEIECPHCSKAFGEQQKDDFFNFYVLHPKRIVNELEDTEPKMKTRRLKALPKVKAA